MKFRGLFWVFFSLMLAPTPLLAAEGIVINPAIQKIFVNAEGVPREPIQTVSIQNTTPVELSFTVRAIEFTELDKSGGNIFLGQSLSDGEFTEAQWLDVSEPTIFLIPGEKKEITFRLQKPESLLPGAHYGALLFETVRPTEREGADDQKIFLRQIATSLLYVSKESGQEQKMRVGEIKRYHSFPHLLDSLVITFANEGNSFIEPRGLVTAKNIFGASVGKSILNESGKLLVPGQERQIEVKFEKLFTLLPGPYTFDIFYRTGEEEYQSTSVTFWYWEPLLLLTALFVLLAILLFAWRQSQFTKKTPKDV